MGIACGIANYLREKAGLEGRVTHRALIAHHSAQPTDDEIDKCMRAVGTNQDVFTDFNPNTHDPPVLAHRGRQSRTHLCFRNRLYDEDGARLSPYLPDLIEGEKPACTETINIFGGPSRECKFKDAEPYAYIASERANHWRTPKPKVTKANMTHECHCDHCWPSRASL